ncbi:MAG: HIT family protein [Candidatus Tectimicrobiota bacterium]|nr:MAG: HIT family protein [Candidatus Tectomicrobia bacterium]
MAECVFCAIVAGQLPSTVVAENAQALAIMDINPAADGHVLVLPKAHSTDLFDLPPEVGAGMMRLCLQVAQAIRRALQPEGLNLLHASGRAAGQEVFHTHFHLVPRRQGDGVLRWWEMRPGDAARIQQVAQQLRAALEG